MPNSPPAHPSTPLSMASRARKAISIAPTLSASFIPSIAPAPAASSGLTQGRSISARAVPLVSGSPSSGNSSLLITSAIGAAITEAAMRWSAGTPNEMYTAITPAAIVPMPPTITECSSDPVRRGTYGLMNNGASVWPTKMLAAPHSDSAPEARIDFIITHAIPCTTRCSTPK